MTGRWTIEQDDYGFARAIVGPDGQWIDLNPGTLNNARFLPDLLRALNGDPERERSDGGVDQARDSAVSGERA